MDETHKIIRSEPTGEVMEHIRLCHRTTKHHVLAALKRRHLDIFNAVLGKADELPQELPLTLILAPPIFLRRSLQAGLDVNQFKRKGESFLEMAVRKQRVKHVAVLLKHPRTKLTPKATKIILNEVDSSLEVFCVVSAVAKTGVEMEAIMGVNAALITIYDLSKIVNSHLKIDNVKLLIKEGGKSGLWTNPDGLPEFLKNIF